MSTTVDVRSIVPRERHPLIFSTFDGLKAGDTMELVNDHDPKPLRYQLDAEHPGQYRWNPVDSGPTRWIIDIVSRARVVDARPVIANGGEPFDMIMDAAASLGEDEILVVRAPFDPVPLQGVLGEQGFGYVSDQIAEDDWRTTFVRS